MTGMTRGICYACAELVAYAPEKAKEILRSSGIDLADAEAHGVDEYDLNRLRGILEEIENEP